MYIIIIVISISIVLLSILYVTKQFIVLVSCTHYQCVELYACIICECVSLCDECVFTLVRESWRAIKDLKAPFPDLKAGHVDHLLTCIFF